MNTEGDYGVEWVMCGFYMENHLFSLFFETPHDEESRRTRQRRKAARDQLLRKQQMLKDEAVISAWGQKHFLSVGFLKCEQNEHHARTPVRFFIFLKELQGFPKQQCYQQYPSSTSSSRAETRRFPPQLVSNYDACECYVILEQETFFDEQE